MSVEYCVLRISPRTFDQLQQQSSILDDLMDAFYASSLEMPEAYVDSRSVYQGAHLSMPAIVRLFYADEFTTSLLVDFKDEHAAVFAALVGWGSAQLLSRVSYGYGEVGYYLPDDVKRRAHNLHQYPDELLVKRFERHRDMFRIAAAGYFETDQAILAHQRTCVAILRHFYAQAVQAEDVILLLTV